MQSFIKSYKKLQKKNLFIDTVKKNFWRSLNKKMSIRKVEKIVNSILEEKPETRTNDNILILEYMKRTEKIEKESFERVMQNTKISFESITRARRNIQRNKPYLKNNVVDDFRKEKEAEYLKYYCS